MIEGRGIVLGLNKPRVAPLHELEGIALQPSNTPVYNAFPPQQARTPANAISQPQQRVSPNFKQAHPVVPIERTPIPVDAMLDTWDAAEVLGISHARLKKWRARGQGPQFVRYPDGCIRYRLSDLMKFLEVNTVYPPRSGWPDGEQPATAATKRPNV